MKRFGTLLVCLLLGMFLFTCALELLVPWTQSTFRTFEHAVVLNRNLFNGPFYPLKSYDRDEEGDLAHGNSQAVLKPNIHWETDGLGYRNREVPANIEYLILGASFVYGQGLSQHELLSEQLENHTKKTCHALAPCTVNQFLNLLHKKVISKPTVVILACPERRILNRTMYDKTRLIAYRDFKNSRFWCRAMETADRVSKHNALNHLRVSIFGIESIGIQSKVDPHEFFYQGSNALIEAKTDDLEFVLSSLRSYQRTCDSLGIRFIFLPIPNKETILFPLVPFRQQPTFLKEFQSTLRTNGLEFVDILSPFNASDIKLYHSDDSHWNAQGVELAAKAIAEHLE